METFEEKREKQEILAMTEQGVATHFGDKNMFKTFQYFDTDRSGRLGKQEIRRVLDLWNIPVDDRKLELLMQVLDEDGDGGISYEEFVDHLARGTVAPSAMKKRGMQSKDAMGVDAFEMLNQQLGHGTTDKGFVPSINVQDDEKVEKLRAQIEAAISTNFTSSRTAFVKMAKAKSNKCTAEELHKAVVSWRVPTSLKEVQSLVARLDDNGNGMLDYQEFAKGLMRNH